MKAMALNARPGVFADFSGRSFMPALAWALLMIGLAVLGFAGLYVGLTTHDETAWWAAYAAAMLGLMGCVGAGASAGVALLMAIQLSNARG